MSMTRDQMMRCLDDPLALNEKTSGELREILDEFPYFQSAHLLYVRNLQNESNFRFSGQLKICSVYVSDRTILYRFLNPEPIRSQVFDDQREINTVSQHDDQPTIELSGDPSEHRDSLVQGSSSRGVEADGEHFDLLNFEIPDSSYNLLEIGNEAEKPEAAVVLPADKKPSGEEKGGNKEQKTDLIDRFIRDNPAFAVRQTENQATGDKVDKQVDKGGESDEFITETLARIYVRQGLYQKAIVAFQKLSLKYPEKSVYFARQIEEVTNLLNK